ncbi:SusC/RagA family TonB-linked outer membrane protein [Pedobacter sp. BG31]|uniref:SusC/RagA family TonB-linked outer membrane protein n=1 Tax=Pedobacter sp. BG31 TaxID=3349697 RepID=UPI0035F312BA
MKLATLMLIIALVQASAKGFGQKITLHEKNAPLEKVLKSIESQSNYVFFFDAELARQNVSIHIKNASVDDVLTKCFKNTALTHKIADRTIFIRQKKEPAADNISKMLIPTAEVKGLVLDQKTGTRLAGATVGVKRTKRIIITDENGRFSFNGLIDTDTLIFNYIGYEKQEVAIKGKPNPFVVQMKLSSSKLDEVQVMAYGQITSRRLNTGSTARITAEDIAKQPVTNILQAIEGRMPGVLVTQANGLPNAEINIQIRGQNSLGATNYPLIIVDGVPYPAAPIATTPGFTDLQGPNGSGSTLYNINPSDIESVEVLKDADATAIYGSRAANGVILITTKRSKQGKNQLDVVFNRGISKVTKKVALLDISEYLALRRQGFTNAGITPTVDNAPDLLVWDTTKTQDFQKQLIGNTASTTNASASFSGGAGGTSFLLSSNYSQQNTVFPDSRNSKSGGVRFNINHISNNQKLNLGATALFASNSINMPGGDFASAAFRLPPNYTIYTTDGQLNWAGGLDNPYASLNQTYLASNRTLVGDFNLRYNLLSGLDIKTSVGFSQVDNKQNLMNPSTAINPANLAFLPPYANYTNSTNETYTFEPQLQYVRTISKGKLDMLVGATLQKTVNEQPYYIRASGYTSDLFLSNLALASAYTVSNGYSAYQFASLFGRINYNWENKYILNLTGRRDGSSRFGPGKRYSNFGAIGGAWLFSNESFLKDKLNWFTYGKFRGSYGLVGNDQIGNYQYLATYRTSSTVNNTYGGVTGLVPARIANSDYQWEGTRKLQLAAELGFFKDRILLTADWFRNRSSNQLVNYPLSAQTGFSSYQANLPAVVENSGWELTLNSTNIRNKDFTWITTFNATIPKNNLVSFPNIGNSPYANTYTVGHPLASFYKLQVVGRNAKGFPLYADPNNNGIVDYNRFAGTGNNNGDLLYAGKSYPDFYGGLGNSFTYKEFQLDIFFRYVLGLKKQGLEAYSSVPGSLANIPKAYIDQLREDNLLNQFTTAGYSSLDYTYYSFYSDANLQDASFLRLQNVALSYTLRDKYLKPLHMSRASIFVQAQNLFVITKYRGVDPESGALSTPPYLTVTAGVQCSF